MPSMRAYSSGVKLCFWTSSGVIAGSCISSSSSSVLKFTTKIQEPRATGHGPCDVSLRDWPEARNKTNKEPREHQSKGAFETHSRNAPGGARLCRAYSPWLAGLDGVSPHRKSRGEQARRSLAPPKEQGRAGSTESRPTERAGESRLDGVSPHRKSTRLIQSNFPEQTRSTRPNS